MTEWQRKSFEEIGFPILQVQHCEVDTKETPTLCELEQACRRVAGGKASGLDGMPSDLLKYCPAATAKRLYTLLLKIGIHGQEPLDHNGGLLVPLWKGKLAKDKCEAFRSILIASSIGKALRRALRSKQLQTIGSLSTLSSPSTTRRATWDFRGSGGSSHSSLSSFKQKVVDLQPFRSLISKKLFTELSVLLRLLDIGMTKQPQPWRPGSVSMEAFFMVFIHIYKKEAQFLMPILARQRTELFWRSILTLSL